MGSCKLLFPCRLKGNDVEGHQKSELLLTQNSKALLFWEGGELAKDVHDDFSN